MRLSYLSSFETFLKDYDNLLELGCIEDFDSPFVTCGGRGTKNWDGVIQFGHIMIETNPIEEY